MTDRARLLFDQLWALLGFPTGAGPVSFEGRGDLPSAFAVSDLAQASVGVAGAAAARFVERSAGGTVRRVSVDRSLASAWFASSIRPVGWQLPPAWDGMAGDYRSADGWIRLHTNAPHHRAAASRVLGLDDGPGARGAPGLRQRVADAVAARPGEELETAVVEGGGAAAVMRSLDQWRVHPQGRAVASEPLLHVEAGSRAERGRHRRGGGGAASDLTPERPLLGIRVLDLTRVLAGPVATRLLAGWGADVLRVDPPDWDEPPVVPEMTLGKRCCRLDLRSSSGRDTLRSLLASADVLVHGYRADALEGLGLGAGVRSSLRPGLVDVSLDAYGWTGPWRNRRGFDSLVQMSSGIAAAGGIAADSARPVPLPVQALDHATGYLLAAAALAGLVRRAEEGVGSEWRASLARTADLLVGAGVARGIEAAEELEPPEPDESVPIETTAWGPARRLRPPVEVDGAPLRWDRPARPLGSDPPRW